jgi:hypothetical protein
LHVHGQAPKGSDEARIAVEIRNALLYDFTGGGYAAPSTHRLKIAISSTRASIIVDVHTSRPDVESYGINATYSLTENWHRQGGDRADLRPRVLRHPRPGATIRPRTRIAGC